MYHPSIFFCQYETPNGVICGYGVIQYRDAVIRRLYVMVGLPDVWISQQFCIMHYELCISPVSVLLYQFYQFVHSLVFRNEFLDTFLFFIKVDFASC